MKLIENSVDAENLQTSLSHADLEDDMASCDIAKMNGEQTKEEGSSGIKKKVPEITKLQNGIHKQSESSSKCNGSINGYFEDVSDDDYQLVLESSSDDGGSPTKKIDDDTISAPQIVQEIEDLLGINGNGVGIEDLEKELTNLDSAESIDLNDKDEDNLANVELSDNVPQEIQDVFEEQIDTTEEVDSVSQRGLKKKELKDEINQQIDTSDEVDSVSQKGVKKKELKNEINQQIDTSDEVDSVSQKEVKKKELKNEINQQIDTSDEVDIVSQEEAKKEVIKDEIRMNHIKTTECDSSSNMNLVFDEVEIGTDSSEANDSNLDVISSGKELVDSSSESAKLNDCKVESTTESHILDESEELEVNEVDNVVTNETDKTCNNIEKEIDMETNCVEATETNTTGKEEELPLTQTSGLSESSVEWTVIDSVETSDDDKSPVKRKPDDKECSEEKSPEKQKPDDKTCSESQVNITKEIVENMVVDSQCQSEGAIDTYSPLCSEGEGPRKRAASVDEEYTETKKPKIVKEGDSLFESPAQVLKRPYSENISHETKRTKLGEIRPVPKLVPVSDIADDNRVSEGSYEEDCVKKDKHTKEVQSEKPEGQKREEYCVSIAPKTCIEIEKNAGEVDNKENSLGNLTSEKEETPLATVTSNIKSNPVEEASKIDCEVSESKLTEESEKQPIESNLVSKDCTQSSEVDSTPEELMLTSDASKTAVEKASSNEVSTSDKNIEKPLVNSRKPVETIELECKDSKEVVSLENEACNEKMESAEVSSSSSSSSTDCSTEEEGCKLDIGGNSKEKGEKAEGKEEKKPKPEVASSFNGTKRSVKTIEDVKEDSKPFSINQDNNRPSSVIPKLQDFVKKVEPVKEESVKNSKSPFNFLSKHMIEQKLEPKRRSNLDIAIDSVVEKARNEAGKTLGLPLLKKFHKDQLKKLTRMELEEAVVLKICEAVTDRSEIGQMRLRCQSLEQNNEIWRKKALQFEKQNRELEMVLKRYLSETAQIKRESSNKVALPIKVTRSVGLQVVLASSMHGALVASKNRINAEPTHSESSRMANQQQHQREQQQANTRFKQPEREPAKEVVKANTFTPPVQPSSLSRPRGRPAKIPSVQGPNLPASLMTPSPQPSTSKVTPPSTPVKSITPTKTIPSPSKDLEVIDLTDKEERAKAVPQNPLSGSIRVSPSTQVCFVQPTTATTPSQPMAYIVQKQGQKQHYLVTTSSSPGQPRPVGTPSIRQPPALALPVFRAGGQIIPVQTSSPVAVRVPNNVVTTTSPRQVTHVPQAVRVQPRITVRKHPAPLPFVAKAMSLPGYKAPPPEPQLKIAKTVNGIMLSWSMNLTSDLAEMASYQLYAYQESNQPPTTNLWKKVGDVKALPLPMACTLTQFVDGHKYHFAVRAVDVHGRIGPFSLPCTILLTK